jgi:two-component system response regulator DevR
MTVLIADDSDALVRRLVGLLADVDGLEVIGRAGTVPEVARAIRTLKPDVVILDLQMPGGSGIDVLEGLQQDGATPVVPVVIVLTNHAGPQYRKKCLKSGARFFMDKSTEFERVGAVLSSLIRDADPTA